MLSPLATTRVCSLRQYRRQQFQRADHMFQQRHLQKRNETASVSAGTGLGIICNLPREAIKRGNSSCLGSTLFLAVIGRIGLSCNHKHLADTDVLNDGMKSFFSHL